MRSYSFGTALLFVLSSFLFSCNSSTDTGNQDTPEQAQKDLRIVSLSGALTEILSGLGMEKNLAGVDITSNFPASVQSLPKVGHTHNLNTEAIIALKPDYVLSLEERGIKPEQAAQLEQAGIKVWKIKQEYSVEGTKQLINTLADSFHKKEAAAAMITAIDNSIKALPQYTDHPKVLFIYARGAGTLQVSGTGTPMATMIALAGGTNAGSDFEDFKPLTAEALVKQNPDVILLFESGMKSLDGAEGLMKAPGVAQTNAGKNKRFVEMDGEKLSGFGPRVGEAIKELGELIHEKK